MLARDKDVLALIEALDAEGESGPRGAIRALARIGRPALKHLLKAAKSPGIRLRRWAIEALAEVGGPGVREAVRKGTRDPAMSVRYHALQALLRIRDPQAVPHLIRLLKGSERGCPNQRRGWPCLAGLEACAPGAPKAPEGSEGLRASANQDRIVCPGRLVLGKRRAML
ncbi:MAG: HEAT repeat domain-containing protein [Planctomycetes bacterium]|nr:HEAT repeat domain-containing protein [Planctomycetota bacterium]